MALPLYGSAVAQAVSITSALLAIATITVAIGSIAAGLTVRLISPRALLALGMGTAGLGDAILIQGSFAALAVGSVLVGSGLGLYWAGSQAVLSSQSGQPGSERAFIKQFVIYSLGTVSGSVVTGAVSNLLHSAGLSITFATRAGFGIGLASAAVALTLNVIQPPIAKRAGRIGTITGGAGRDAILQLTDLCLVAALAFILALAPVVLSAHFGFDALQVGVGYGAVSLAKMAGSFLAGRAVRRSGYGRAIALILSTGALFGVLLAITNQPIAFVIVLAFAGMTAGGVWPVVVDATLASVRPDRRAAMALTWSAREYPVIALATIAGGWLLDVSRSLTVLYLVTAALLAASALASRMLRGPP